MHTERALGSNQQEQVHLPIVTFLREKRRLAYDNNQKQLIPSHYKILDAFARAGARTLSEDTLKEKLRIDANNDPNIARIITDLNEVVVKSFGLPIIGYPAAGPTATSRDYICKAKINPVPPYAQDAMNLATVAIDTPTQAPFAKPARVAVDEKQEVKHSIYVSSDVLTQREKKIFDLAISGMTRAAMAEQLSLVPDTLNNTIRNIYKKLGSKNLLETALIAEEKGILTSSEQFPAFDVSRLSFLTAGAVKILDCMIANNGHESSTRAIAAAIGHNRQTVKWHIASIRQTLGTRNINEIALYYRKYKAVHVASSQNAAPLAHSGIDNATAAQEEVAAPVEMTREGMVKAAMILDLVAEIYSVYPMHPMTPALIKDCSIVKDPSKLDEIIEARQVAILLFNENEIGDATMIARFFGETKANWTKAQQNALLKKMQQKHFREFVEYLKDQLAAHQKLRDAPPRENAYMTVYANDYKTRVA